MFLTKKEIKNQLIHLIGIALGETSALFMSKTEKGTEIVMPINDLLRIQKELVKDIQKLTQQGLNKGNRKEL